MEAVEVGERNVLYCAEPRDSLLSRKRTSFESSWANNNIKNLCPGTATLLSFSSSSTSTSTSFSNSQFLLHTCTLTSSYLPTLPYLFPLPPPPHPPHPTLPSTSCFAIRIPRPLLPSASDLPTPPHFLKLNHTSHQQPAHSTRDSIRYVHPLTRHFLSCDAF